VFAEIERAPERGPPPWKGERSLAGPIFRVTPHSECGRRE